MPYICLARTDIPDGTLQILDLKPNSSNRNLIYEPEGQTKYVNRATNEAPLANGDGTAAYDFNGLRAYIADRIDPTGLVGNVWSLADLATAATALLAEVDAGNALTAADINAALLAALGVGVGIAINASTATVPELLSVLSGRGYVLTTGWVKLTGGLWDAVQRGAFTTPVLHFGDTWQFGEIKPAAIGGDTVQVETKPIKHTYDGTHFQLSLGSGHLLTFASGITLFPDSDLVPHHPWEYQGTWPHPHPQVNNARVVTVYDDLGNLLA